MNLEPTLSTTPLFNAAACPERDELYIPLPIEEWIAADIWAAAGMLELLSDPGAGEFRITPAGLALLNRKNRN